VPRTQLTNAASLIPGQIDTNGQQLGTSGNFGAFLPRANLLWRATDSLNLYATVSQGRRSPVVQLNAGAGGVANINNVAAEIVDNYEVGFKFSQGGINATLGAFLMKYNNFQVSIVRPGLPNLTTGAGTATNQGLEAEFGWQLSPQLNVFASGAYIDARVDDNRLFPAFANDRFRLQSRWQWAVGANASLPLGDNIELFANPTVTYRSSLFFELPNNPVTFQGSVTLANLRAGVRAQDGKWEVIGYANNLFDRQYLLDAGNTGGAFGIPTFIRGLPRLFGVEAVIRFN
jgi:outer membrane receptor protein involved in Fe transport